MKYGPDDVAYLTANPHVWRKFERTFGTLPDGFSVPEPEESDYDYLKQNPQMKDRFIETFGEKAYQLAPSYVPQPAEGEPASAAPTEPEERKTGYGAIWKTFSDAYEQDGLIGVKNVLMSPTDPQLVQDFLSAGNDDDETFWGKYNQFQNDKSLMVMRSVARLGEGVAFLPEATLQYFGFDDAAAVPGKFRDGYKAAEKEFVAAMSPEARKAIEQQFVQRAADGSYEMGEGSTNPLWWMAAGIDTAIMMAPGVGIGGKAGRLAYGVAHSRALAKAAISKAPTAVAFRAAEKAGKKAALIATATAYTAGEAIPAAGMAGSAIEQTLVSLDEESLSSYEPYLELRNQGLSHEAARAQIANDQAVKGALGVAIATGLTGAPVASLIAKFAATGAVAKTMAGAVAKGVVAESAQEGLQEGSQQYIQNWAEKPITHIDPWEGVLESAVTGAVLGGLIGGGVAGVAQASGPVDAEKDPSRSPVLRKGLREYNAARDNLYNAIGSAKDPNTKISFKDVEAAREQFRAASLTLNEALLSSGVLKPEQQAEVAKAIEEAKASGIKGLQQDVNDVKGAVRPADEAGAPKGDAGSAAAQAEAAKEGAAPQLNSVETGRLETLTKVASADTVTAEEIQSLVKDGLAKVLPSGVPMLLPAGKRQREELSQRLAKQEAAAATEKPQEKPAAAKAQPAKEPAKSQPAPQAAKPAPVPAAPLAPGYADTEILQPGEKPKPLAYEPSEGETRALSADDYAALERHEAGKSVTPEEMTNLVKVGLVAPREGGKVFVTRPLGKRELKAYREAGRLTAYERDLQQDIGITGDTLRLSAEARRTGRKARAEAAAAQAQVDQIFEETKKAAGPKVAAELGKMAAEREAELAAEKDKDWDRAKEEVELDEYETLTTLFDEEARDSLSGTIRGILKQVDAKAKRREAAARGRLKIAFSSTRAFDITGALVEGSKVWKDIVEVGAMKLLQGIVRIPDWNAAMEKSLKKQWVQIAPHLDKILSQSREVARNPLKLLQIKHQKANKKTERLRGQPAGRGLVLLRAQMEALRAEGEPHRFWYEQSSKVIMEVVNNDVPQARKLAGLLAIYSSGTAVDANTGNALKAWYQWLDGKKIETGSEIQIKAGRFRSQDRDAETWLARGEFPVGTKRSNFYVNLMREIDPAEFDGFQGATVDLWMMRAFGYHAEAPNDAQYAFVATEIQRMARDLGWEPQQVQAAIWVAAKARYENTEAAAKQEAARRKYVKFVPGPKGKDRMEILDLRRYNRLRRDYALKALFSPTDRMDFGTELEKRMAQINWESKPSVTAGVLPGIHSEQKIERIAEYHAAIARALQDETGADALARRLGMLSFGQVDGPSAWYYNRDDYFRFTHYSKRLKGEFVTLDIGKFGTGVAMTPAEQSRGPRIFLYPENAELVESAVTQGATEYTVEVLKEDMYDFTADPMGFRKGKSFDAAEDAIRLAGFRGYFVKDHADAMLRGQARLFHSHPAVRADVSQTFRGYVGSGSALRIALPRLHGNSGADNAPKVESAAAQKMSAYSAILGAIIKQDAVSWAMPYYTPTQEFSNGVDIDLGRPLTSAEVAALYRSTVEQLAARGITDDSVLHMLAPIQHGSGAYFLNFTAPSAQEVKDSKKTKKAAKALKEKYAGGIPNIEFHGIIRKAIDTVFTTEADLFKETVETITFSRFASDGDMVSNDWKVDRNGEGYRRRAEEAGEREAFEWAVSVLGPKIEAINKDFGERYGWARRERKDEGFGLTTPLAGMPANAKGPGGVLTPMGPSSKVRLIAQAYMRAAGFTYTPPQDYVRVDPEVATRVAAAYDALKHDPNDPDVKASYDAFAKETLAQWEWVKKAGLKVEVIPVDGPDPYAGNPRNAIRDIVDNNHFWLFPTAAGLGNEIHGDTPKDHPILAKAGEKIGDHELLVNDIFRITHDYFGHAKEGVGFRADGEYNAWRQHSAMYSPLARRAMSAETLGQNSWMNYGPFGEKNRTASAEESVFAEQKAALLPEEFTSDDAVMFSPAESVGPGMTVDQVRDAIEPIRQVTGIPVRIVRTFTDLPKYIQDWSNARGIRPAGVFAQRQQAMYIVADTMNSSFEAVETYAHEVVGHFGLRGVLGAQFKSTMHQLAKSFPVQLQRAAEAHKVSLTDKKLSAAQLENNLLLAAEEMVAHAAGLEFRGTGKMRPRGPYRRIVDYVRSQLLSVGWLKQWNENDLIALIARSHDYAKSGRARRKWAFRDYEARMGKKIDSTPTEFSGDSSVKVTAKPGSGFDTWFKDSKAVKGDGSPQVFYHGTDRAFWTFKVGGRRRGSDGHTTQKSALFFAEQPDFAKDYAGESGRVIPVFLSVQKPLDLTSGFRGLPAAERAALADAMELEGLSLAYYDAIAPGQEWSAFNVEYAFGDELILVLRRAGYDGAKLSEERGGSWVVFSPNQVKSVFNSGEFSLFDDNILARPEGSEKDPSQAPSIDEADETMFAPATGNPILDGFFSKIGKPHIPFRQRMENFTTGLGDRLRQNVLDHFHGIARTGDIEGYMSARLSTGAAGLMRSIMEWGYPVWDQGLHGVAGDKGFNDILRGLEKDVDLWAGWMVARRAQRLKGEGRENLFTDVEISEMLALGNARPDFAVAAAEYAEFKKKVLDFAEEAGIVDPNTRPLWENDDHVPFYRIMEDGLLKGASAGRGIGFVKKQIIQLKGGTQNIGDPIENILRNWTALVEASLQAKASRTVIDNLTGTGLVVKIDQPAQAYQLTTQALQQLLTQAQINPASMSPASQMGLLALSQPAAHKDGQVTIWRNGQRERWQVHDPMLYKSMQAINPTAWSTWMNLLRVPKRVLTKTITVVPLFIMRNFWRDIWSAFTIGSTNRQKIPFIPVLDNLKGVYSMLTTSDTAKTLVSSGAGFIGTGFNPTDAAAEAVSLAKDVRLGHRFWHSPALLYHAYMRLSEAAENASRVAIYEAAIKAGRSKMEAAFEAKDVMDFSLRGSSPIVRFMIETVPFWGARTQGLYKLGRAAASNPAGVAMRGSLLTLATVALLIRNMDDERYKELTLDQKNLYWHAFDLFEEGDHWRIPKPFEVGTIFGTVPEAIIDASIAGSEDPDAAKQSLKVVSHAFLQALDLKPEVAAVWPMVELALNKNTFTGAPVLSMGDEGVLPQEQDAPFVRSTYRMIAHAMPEVAPEALRSPKQLQHLARGYIGSLQDWVLVGTDVVARRIMGEPEPPARAATEPLLIGGFRSTGPARQTKSLNALYDIANEASKIQRSIDKLSKMEPNESTDRRLNQLVEENEFKLGVGDSFGDAARQVSELRKAQRAIQLDTAMTPEEKRAEIESIQKDINELARAMWELRPGGPLDPATASRLTGAGKNTQAAILRRSGMTSTAALVDAMPVTPSRAMSSVFKDLEMKS